MRANFDPRRNERNENWLIDAFIWYLIQSSRLFFSALMEVWEQLQFLDNRKIYLAKAWEKSQALNFANQERRWIQAPLCQNVYQTGILQKIYRNFPRSQLSSPSFGNMQSLLAKCSTSDRSEITIAIPKKVPAFLPLESANTNMWLALAILGLDRNLCSWVQLLPTEVNFLFRF